ncbi:hypothetical protein OJ967_27880 (plasmid) [Peribacillus frigoritolerans]|uniref:hypothetical protein n=1 Tax=Peribacillus frigoritolerans TaxID=450367 RepID=UPI0022273C79|nr:hypothetical protein [Peribacillus frigoritolerans]UYZ01843.1 hypothetical protein OJ967_27880 [Peribacillus frigoritolerans]
MNKNNKFMCASAKESKGHIIPQARKRAVAESFTPGEKWYPKGSPLLSSSTRFIPSGLPVEGYSQQKKFLNTHFAQKLNNEVKHS